MTKKNPCVEIIFRYFLTNNPGADFANVLPFIQTAINNVINTATRLVFNEIIYEFRNNGTLKLITDLPPENFNQLRFIYKKQTEKITIRVKAITKHRYDNQHFATNFEINWIFSFKLNHG